MGGNVPPGQNVISYIILVYGQEYTGAAGGTPHWGAGNAVGGWENAVEQEEVSHVAFTQNPLLAVNLGEMVMAVLKWFGSLTM